MKKLETDILKVLQEDCRYTPAKIAVMLNKTEEEVRGAIESMEKRGIIVKYTAIVNDERLSDDFVQALIEVKVSPQKASGFDAIAEEIYRFDEVQSTATHFIHKKYKIEGTITDAEDDNRLRISVHA